MKRTSPTPQRGAASPLPHCGPAVAVVSDGFRLATRGGFAPPSLRLLPGQSTSASKQLNEGRLRPSLIAAGF